MRAVSRLSTNFLVGRGSRTALLVVAVALSTSLVAAVACALASLNAGMEHRVSRTIGEADVRMRHVLFQRFPASLLEEVRGWDGVVLASGRSREALRLRAPKVDTARDVRTDSEGAEGPGGSTGDGALGEGGGAWGEAVLVSAQGIDPAVEYRMAVVGVDEGRRVEGDDEVVLGRGVAEALGVGVGDAVLAGDGSSARVLEVVGVAGSKVIEMINRPSALVTLQTLRRATGVGDALHEISVILQEGADVRGFVASVGARVPSSVQVEETERVTSGVSGLVRANRFLFLMAGVLSYLASAAIVLVGLTTAVLERQRELALLRCVGATRWQLAGTQLVIGGVIGASGGVLGVPLGVGLAWVLAVLFPDRLPAGLAVWPLGLVAAGLGGIGAGLAGGAWPAWSASRSRPLSSLSRRARVTGGGVVAACGVVGLALAAAQPLLGLAAGGDPVWTFRVYAVAGAPLMFVGYFLLSVPLVWFVSRGLGPTLGRVLCLPRTLLVGSVSSSPMRHGFTAGALMVGLAMMTSVYSNGNGLMRDWLDTIRFPDAFVNGLILGITPELRERVDSLDVVERTCAVSVFKASAGRGGLAELRGPKTYFVAFEPEPFFAMTNLYWAKGEAGYAKRRLDEGGAVLVSQGFARRNPELRVGSLVPVRHLGRAIEFEIVGVVSSPGLSLIRKHFEFEEEFGEFATTSVFGTRADLKRHFGTEAISLIQIELAEGVDDERAVEAIEAAVDNPGYVVGSGKRLKAGINSFGRSIMRIATVIAFGALLIGCAGVASVVVAGVDARRFEFGVLRAVGAERGLLARLVVGEVLLIGVSACVLGTVLGIQASGASMRVYGLLTSMNVPPRPPVGVLAVGWAVLLAMVLGSVAPVVVRLSRMGTRELLFSTRG